METICQLYCPLLVRNESKCRQRIVENTVTRCNTLLFGTCGHSNLHLGLNFFLYKEILQTI